MSDDFESPLDLPISLSASENVLRHQLNVIDYWAGKTSETQEHRSEETGGESQEGQKPKSHENSQWTLSRGFALRKWQLECQDKWFSAGKKGVVKVVTGAGKTVFAVSLIERLQNQEFPDLRVIIVAPTIVLQSQWYDLIVRHGNLLPGAVGRLGGGFRDHLEGDCRILICVLNSAASYLPKMKNRRAENLFLIVDECHRSGSKQMSRIFAVERAFNLGLSATPERDESIGLDDDDQEEDSDAQADPLEFEDSIVGRELGPIIFELDYLKAIEEGILAKFELRHYGLPLEESERTRYEKLSREITELRRQLQSMPSARGMDGGKLVGWARREASRGASDLSARAANYVAFIGERKRLLYSAKARLEAVLRLIEQSLETNADPRILLFHESIDSVMLLFDQLRRRGLPTVVEHSKLTDTLRAESLHLFRDGKANILVSARSLIEGFDVPSADVGIVVASSSSVRQRIQTLGRILRKKESEDRIAVLHILYVADTTDELIYEKHDWATTTGADRNRFYVWNPDSDDEPLLRDGPPRTPKPGESEINWESLSPGDSYPGDYRGEEFTADSQGNVTNASRELVENPQGIPERLLQHRGSYGRFRVTPQRLAVISPDPSSRRVVYLGRLEEAFNISDSGKTTEGTSGKVFDLSIKKKAGGHRVVWKVKTGELFARTSQKAQSAARGEDALRLLAAVGRLEEERGIAVHKVSLCSNLKVYAKVEGKEILLTELKEGLEFMDQELP